MVLKIGGQQRAVNKNDCLFTSRDSLESTIRHRDFFPILPKGGGFKGRGELETLEFVREPSGMTENHKNP